MPICNLQIKVNKQALYNGVITISRMCAPENKLKLSVKKLYIKVTEVIQSEVEEITEQDCIDYMTQLFIDWTFDGQEGCAIKPRTN